MSEHFEARTLYDIPLEFDADRLMRQAHVEPGSDDAIVFSRLVDIARMTARPKAVFRECFVTGRHDGIVEIEGIRFASSVLARNLEKTDRVFAYVATCGAEMDEAAPRHGDPLQDYWWDMLKAVALAASVRFLSDFLVTRYGLGRAASMAPGSGDASVWPVEQQKQLFCLIGDIERLINVRLTESCLMIPNKSVSGMKFQTERDFRTCQLCRRQTCPNRMAPFDRNLWNAFHGLAP